MNRSLIGALVGGSALIACAGCNTVSGFGQDVAAAGRALTQNAHDTSTVEAPKQSMPGCTPDFRRSPPVTCQKTTEPNQTEQVRLAPATQAASATPAPAKTAAPNATPAKTAAKAQ
jgi:predicted small secreted protein